MSSAVHTPNQPRRTADPNATLDQILDRHRELVLQREYQPLGIVDYIWVVRGTTTVQMDFRKTGPKIAFNAETGDFLLLSSWNGLPDLPQADPQRCQSCLGKCGDCQGKGKKPCTLAGCAGSGFVNSRYGLCPDCLGSSKKKTDPECTRCNGRGEVPDPVKCGGCDEKGLARCARCDGSGKVSTGRERGTTDGYDAEKEQFVTAPLCKECKGQGRIIQTKPQDWRPFVHGRINTQAEGAMVAIGPIARILWHTMGDGARFQSCEIAPDRGGNLMVLLLANGQPGARQYLVGGVPQIK